MSLHGGEGTLDNAPPETMSTDTSLGGLGGALGPEISGAGALIGPPTVGADNSS